jgi:type IV secretion system protein VirB4
MILGYGHIFGGEPAEQQDSPITIYELSSLSTCTKYISTPAKELILYQTISSLNGKPTWVLWDEFWEAIGDDTSSAWFFEAIRTMRRGNCSFVGLTQNSVEITQSPHCTLLLSNMPGKLFFPDPQAITPYIAESLYKLGLNPHEVARIASAKLGEFLYKSAAGARLAACWLGPVGRAICASTSYQAVEQARAILRQCADGDFLHAWLRSQGLSVSPTRQAADGLRARVGTSQHNHNGAAGPVGAHAL